MLNTIILAGGGGTRMKSDTPKVLHKIFDKHMINYVIESSEKINSDKVVVVVGHKSDEVKKALSENITIALQKQQLGTGHAVMMAAEHIADEGVALVLCGDTPLIRDETLEAILNFHKTNGNAVTIGTFIVDKPGSYGRIVRENGCVARIVEQKDATAEELEIKEVNSGLYCFDIASLKKALKLIRNDNAQNEYYLTDTIEIIKSFGGKIDGMVAEDEKEFFGVNSKKDLYIASEIMQKRINEQHMENGVTFLDAKTAYIGKDVTIGRDTIIANNVTITGRCEIGDNCEIGSNTTIKNSDVGSGTVVINSIIVDSKIGEFVSVGPFAYVRPNCVIGNNVKIGDFVEIKNSNIGNKTKVPHLSYIGDADLGTGINIGCGTITANYDGVNKFRTIIEDNVFVGSNSNLVAPIKIGEGSFIAAGATVTKEVMPQKLVVARSKQISYDRKTQKTKYSVKKDKDV